MSNEGEGAAKRAWPPSKIIYKGKGTNISNTQKGGRREGRRREGLEKTKACQSNNNDKH